MPVLEGRRVCPGLAHADHAPHPQRTSRAENRRPAALRPADRLVHLSAPISNPHQTRVIIDPSTVSQTVLARTRWRREDFVENIRAEASKSLEASDEDVNEEVSGGRT